jgi:hypothetical protein
MLSDHYLVTATVGEGPTLPKDVFIFTNTGTTDIGEYYGVCSVEELSRLNVYSGVVVPVFGNKYLRYREVKIVVPLQDDPATVVLLLTKNLQTLSNALKTKLNTSQVVNIL